MGQTRTVSRVVALGALAVLMALPMGGCRKLGLDESPRTMPDSSPENLGPKRVPVNQHSSVNTPEAIKAAQTGAISPGPSDMASVPSVAPEPQQPMQATPVMDEYSSYADGNFWSNGDGWSSNPPLNSRAAPPTPQYQPTAQQIPQQMPQQLPPLQLLRQPQRDTFASSQGFSASPMMPPAPAMLPVQSPYPSPYAPGMPTAQVQPTDFPSLQEVPGQPYYRSNMEIAQDIADLQNQSQSAMMYQPPMAQGYGAPQDYGQGYGMPQMQAPAPMMPMASPQTPAMGAPNYYADAAPSYPAYGQQPPMQTADAGWNAGSPAMPSYQQPPMATDQGQYVTSSYPSAYAPMGNASAYSASAFVNPAPVAGVSDMPVAAQDWDSSAYRGGMRPAAPVELRMPHSGIQQPLLPESRYTGQRRSPYGYR